MKDKANELKAGLQHIHGSEMCYKIPLIGTRFTEGIKYLSEKAECFWLLTDASVVAKNLSDKSNFITVDFKRLNGDERKKLHCEATIEYSDGNGNVF